MMNAFANAAIFIIFTTLLVVGAISTLLRSLHYRRRRLPQPVLLPRDRDLLIGLALPFVAIAAVRVFGAQGAITDGDGVNQLWWVLVTGLPPIYALGRYCWFELRVIERRHRR